MTIANLQTFDILKKARLSKDAVGGAVSTGDLKAGGGLLVPEQGGRTGRLELAQRRKTRKPVVLGKSCSELTVEKAKDAGGHGSEKRGAVSQAASTEKYKQGGYDGNEKAYSVEWSTGAKHVGTSPNQSDKKMQVHEFEHPNPSVAAATYAKFHHDPQSHAVMGDQTGDKASVAIVDNHTGHLDHNVLFKKPVERTASAHGKDYHFNDETQRWHDSDGEPTHNQGLHDRLNAQADADPKRTDMTVSNTINDQIGGKAFYMMGTKYKTGSENALSFDVKGSQKFSHVKVELSPDDTYKLTFSKVRGSKITRTESVEGVYADGLRSMIEHHTGLALSL